MSSDNLAAKLATVGTTTTCPAVVLCRNGRVLIGLRHYSRENVVWTMPGGRCQEGEVVESALRREVAEEIGLTDVVVTDFLGIVPGAQAGDIVHLFVGVSNSEPRLCEPEKFSEWKWVTPNELPANFISPPAAKLVQDYVK